MTIMPASPFLSSAECNSAEELPAVVPGTPHHPAGSRFSIDEDSFFYAIDPPPLPPLAADEIEPLLKTLFQRVA